MNVISIHLNEYFQCTATAASVPKRHWRRFESRIERITIEVLDVLQSRELDATFFCSGWMADRVPSLLLEIVSRGHEIASTGYHQLPVTTMSADEFRSEAVKSRLAIERASGKEVVGFRCFGWLRSYQDWPLEILAQEGFQYDTSVLDFGFRVRPTTQIFRRTYGTHRIWEIPVPTMNILGFRTPFLGGTYLRNLPNYIIRQGVKQSQKLNSRALMLYFQVADLDGGQPRLTGLPWGRSVQKYRNIDEMQARVMHILDSHEFCSIARSLGIDIARIDTGSEVGVNNVPKALDTLPEVVNASYGREKFTVVVPCYNEAGTISYLSAALSEFESDNASQYDLYYIFVDDGSTDSTYELLMHAFSANKKAKIVRNIENLGVTAATLIGIREADSELVGIIDSDCTYDPSILTMMAPLMGPNVALVTASPYHPEGRVINVPAWRIFLSRSLSRLYRLVSKTKIATYTSCCRVYRKSVLDNIGTVRSDFSGLSEIIWRIDELNGEVLEFPAILEARMLGTSKMKVLKSIFAHFIALTSFKVLPWIEQRRRRSGDRYGYPQE